MSLSIQRIKTRQEDIHQWLESLEGTNEVPSSFKTPSGRLGPAGVLSA